LRTSSERCRALAREGIEIRTLVPAYPAVREALDGAETVHTFPDLHGGSARLLAGRAAGLELFALDATHLYARPGNPYPAPTARTGPTTRGASPRSRSARPQSRAAPSHLSYRRSRTRMTGRPGSFQRTCATGPAAHASR
jgi:hypothetical protein